MTFSKLSQSISAAACILLCMGSVQAATPIPIEELSQNPAISRPSLDPSGDYLWASITPPGETKSALAVWDLRGETPKVNINRTDKDVEIIAVFALKRGYALVITRKEWTGAVGLCGGEGSVTGNTKTFVRKTFLVDKGLKKWEELDLGGGSSGLSETTKFCLDLFGQVSIGGGLPLEPNKIIVSRVDLVSQKTDYFKLDLKTRKSGFMFSRTLEQPGIGLLDSRSGEILVEADLKVKDGKYMTDYNVYDPRTKKLESQPSLSYDQAGTRRSLNFLGPVSEKKRKYYVLTDKFSDKMRIYIYDVVKGAFETKPFAADENFSITGMVLGELKENFGKPVGYNVEDGFFTTHFFPDEKILSPIVKQLRSAFPGKHPNITNYSRDLSRVLFRVGATGMPFSYYLLYDKKRAVPVGNSRPWLQKYKLSVGKLIYYEARDGLRVPAFIFTPPDWQKGRDKPGRAVVLPHGGPWASDNIAFMDPWVQFYASRGFVVLKPQYRGSTDHGIKLWKAGDNEWGQKMQDDKDDGAKWLVDQGYADAKQIMIFGYSYGGFAAIAASVRRDGPFRCAIAGAGVADLGRLGTRFFTGNRFNRRFQGSTVSGMNPIENADKVNIPILLYTGDRDVRVPPFHSKNFYKKIRNKTHAKLVVIPDMPHSNPWRVEWNVKSYQVMEDFLKDPKGCNYNI